MRTWNKSLWTGLVSLGLVLAWITPAQGGSFEEDVAMMISGVEEAWNERDPGALASMFTKKADLHSRDGQWFTGPDEIAGYFEEWIASTEGPAKDIDLQRSRQLSESLAVVDVISRLRDRRGSVVEQVFVSVVVERQLDGSWQFTAWRECSSMK